LLGNRSIRRPYLLLAGAFCLLLAGPAVRGQGTPGQTPPGQPAPTQPAQPAKDDNPFPGDAPQAPASQSSTSQAPTSQAPTSQAQPASQTGQTAKPGSDNPFPGEDSNVPIIPLPGAPGSDAASGDRAGDAGRTPRRDSDPDGDPVRSPDPAGNFAAADDGFSSSRSGLKQPSGDEQVDARPGKSAKSKTREQLIKEDIDVGGFYMEKKEWKGAKSRFADAFALDGENSDALWGLAEAERHLQLYTEAADHYKLLLSYEPDGKRGREARKGLEAAEAAKSAASNGPK